MPNFDDYQYLFYKVLASPVARPQLYNFMKDKERNIEMLLFYEACEEKDLLSISVQQQNNNEGVSPTTHNIHHSFYFNNNNNSSGSGSGSSGKLNARRTRGATSSGPIDKSSLDEIVLDIYSKFIDRTTLSHVHLNISAETVIKVTQEVHNFVNNAGAGITEARQVFKPALTSVLNSMEKDVFVRFVRSEDWKRFVKTKFSSISDLEQIAVHKSQLKQMILNCEDEERVVITGRDVAFVRNLMRDEINWELLHTSTHKNLKYVDTLMVFKSNLKLADDALEQQKGKLHTVKMVLTFNLSAKDVFTTLHCGEKCSDIFGELRHENARMVPANNSFLESSTDTSRTSTTITMHDLQLNSELFTFKYGIRIPFTKKRENIFCYSAIYLPDPVNTYFIIMKPAPETAILFDDSDDLSSDTSSGSSSTSTSPTTSPLSPKTILSRAYSWIAFEAIDECKCRMVSVTSLNLGGRLDGHGKLTNWARDKSYVSVFNHQAKQMDKALRWYVDEMKRPTRVRDDNRVFEIVQLNTQVAPLLLERWN